MNWHNLDNSNRIVFAKFLYLKSRVVKNVEVYTQFYWKFNFVNNGASFVNFRVRLLCRLASGALS